MQRLVADVCAVARALLLRAAAEDDAAAAATPHATSAAPPPPPLVIVGHSMGGAVAARVAARMAAREAPDALATALCGVAVLDIVEGTALALAPAMRALLASRPDRFDDLAAARKWARAAPGVAFASQLVPLAGGAGVAWRTPLRATEPFWDGWFRCAAAHGAWRAVDRIGADASAHSAAASAPRSSRPACPSCCCWLTRTGWTMS